MFLLFFFCVVYDKQVGYNMAWLYALLCGARTISQAHRVRVLSRPSRIISSGRRLFLRSAFFFLSCVGCVRCLCVGARPGVRACVLYVCWLCVVRINIGVETLFFLARLVLSERSLPLIF